VTNNNVLILVNSSLCGIYFCHTSSHRHKSDGQILFHILSSSEYDIAKTIKFNNAIDASVKERKVKSKFLILHEKC
jgi:hypothetical protein